MPPREWFTDEHFWRDLYPFMFNEARQAEPAEQVGDLLALADPRGRTALDLCCGPGRWSVVLARRGFTVTGVDRSPFLLEKARRRADEMSVAIEFVEQDMRAFQRPGAYDLALSMFTSFGYFADRDEDLAVLANLHRSLKPGGVLVIDLVGKERLARIFQPASVEELADGSTLIERHQVIDDWTRIRNEWIVLREDYVRTYNFELRVYSGQELRDRLERVGFDEVILCGDFAGTPYGLESPRLVAVARRR